MAFGVPEGNHLKFLFKFQPIVLLMYQRYQLWLQWKRKSKSMKPRKRLNKLSRTFYGKRLVAAYNPRCLDYDIPLMDHYPADNSILLALNSWVVINLLFNACVANGGWVLKDLGTDPNNPKSGWWNTP